MKFELWLNVLLIALLLPTLVSVVLLHRRLSSLRADRTGIEAVIERMDEATRRAEASLKGIRSTAEQAKTALDEPMARAHALRDELAYLVQRADAAGERLAGGLSGAASAAAPAQAAGVAKPRPVPRGPAKAVGETKVEPPGDDVRSQAERDLMNALRNVR